MTTYVALLRAVNVGAANRIKMDDLRKSFVEAGYADVVTHIQSGNAIFTSSNSAAAVKASIETLIRNDLGKTITAIIRTAGELRAVAEKHPFGTSDKSLYVSFLDGKPTQAAADALSSLEFAEERFEIVGREVYIDYRRAHAGTSKLNNAIIENKLGVAATSRNWTVVNNLASLATGHGR